MSDLTLNIGLYPMPIMRQNNFQDVTWDVDINQIPIVVRNEQLKPTKLHTITLRQYLENFGTKKNIFVPSHHYVSLSKDRT